MVLSRFHGVPVPSRLAFALDVLFEEHVFAIEYGVGELPYPVAENHHACLLAQHQVQFDVPVSVDEVVDVLMVLHVLLGETHEKRGCMKLSSRWQVRL